jgi:GNAT superfamily N-acetyltransferase
MYRRGACSFLAGCLSRHLGGRPVLDSLSVTEREGRWLALLGNTEHHWLNLVAEDGNGGLAGFCAVTTPSREAKEDESLPEVGALYVDPDRWREGAGAAMLIAACG